MSRSDPQRLSLERCDKLGWHRQGVERRRYRPAGSDELGPCNPRRTLFVPLHRTEDLFGFADIVALDPSSVAGIVAIQATSRANAATRRKKIENEPLALAWLDAGGRVEVWGWDQPGGKGSRWRLAAWAAVTTNGIEWAEAARDPLTRA